MTCDITLLYYTQATDRTHLQAVAVSLDTVPEGRLPRHLHPILTTEVLEGEAHLMGLREALVTEVLVVVMGVEVVLHLPEDTVAVAVVAMVRS